MNLRGIELRGELPSEQLSRVYGQFKGVCLLLGSSPSVFRDIRDAKELLGDTHFDVMAVNLSFLAWGGRLTHLVSLHQDRLLHFHELAKLLPETRKVDDHIYTHSWMECPQVECAWDILDNNGTSGLFAVKIAHLLGYDKIILCGEELMGNHRFYDNPYDQIKNNFGCDAIELSWRQYRFLPWRSMSGKPASINGVPTKEWIYGDF